MQRMCFCLRKGGRRCKNALNGKWFKMKMPDECYLNVNPKSRMNCQNEIISHCKSVEEEETMIAGRRGCYKWGTTAFKMDGSVDAQPLPDRGFRHHYECQTQCALDDACKAFTFKYFTAFTTLPGRGHCYFYNTKPDTYLQAESRFYVSGPDHCTEFDTTPIDTPRNQLTQSLLNYSANIFAIVGFLSVVYGLNAIYRTSLAKAEYDHINDLEL
eukprot:UN22904